VIPPETTLRLYVKFFSKKGGNFDSTLTFENNFNLKKISIPVSGRTDFPSISNQPKQLFSNVKKARPTSVPECYLSKSYILSENTFDFGPLLIGKNA
jgi:hydrocephalus-inducing protein